MSNTKGYSLLEVLLALALTVAIFSVIAMAIRIHLVSLAKQQATIERKQIVRAIFNMFATDLRAGIQYKATDYSGLENMIATQQLTAGAAPAGLGDVEEELAEGEGESEEEAPVYDEAEVSFRPTLLGSESVVMIDISRLPRLDQYNPLVASASTLLQSPSDVKSIGYFVANNMGAAEETMEFSRGAEGGLFRREVDRAVASYAGDFSLVTNADPFSKLIAHEIVQVSFRYFDGSDWQTEWDSEDSGGFPLAIEINLVIDPARTSQSNVTYSGVDLQSLETYRGVVHLPAAEAPPEEE